MDKYLSIKISTPLIFLLLSFPAFSSEITFYGTAGTGMARVDVGDEFLNDDAPGFYEESSAYNYALGARFNKWFGIERGNSFAGTGIESFFEGDSIEFESSYVAATVQFDFPDRWFFQLKAGEMSWDAMADGDYIDGDGRATETGTSKMALAALGWRIKDRFTIDVNYMASNVTDGFDMRVTSVNFTYLFFTLSK